MTVTTRAGAGGSSGDATWPSRALPASPVGDPELAVRSYLMSHWADPSALQRDSVVRGLLHQYTSQLRSLGLEPEAMLIRIKRLLGSLGPHGRRNDAPNDRAYARSCEVVILVCIEEYFEYRRSRP